MASGDHTAAIARGYEADTVDDRASGEGGFGTKDDSPLGDVGTADPPSKRERCERAAEAMDPDDIVIEHATSCEANRKILRRLRDDTVETEDFCVSMHNEGSSGIDDNFCIYVVKGDDDLKWLGHFIGRSNTLKRVIFKIVPTEEICRGICFNTSIETISFWNLNLANGHFFRWLRPFFESNASLSNFKIWSCTGATLSGRRIAAALHGCVSLKEVNVHSCKLKGDGIDRIIESLGSLPHLKEINLDDANVWAEDCEALSPIFSNTSIEVLDLSENPIGDRGLKILVDGILSAGEECKMKHLHLRDIQPPPTEARGEFISLTSEGARSLAVLLGCNNSHLEFVDFGQNNIGDGLAIALTEAVADNRKLTKLFIDENLISDEGWSSLSNILCDVSSVNSTFFSNHTLTKLKISTLHLNEDDEVESMDDSDDEYESFHKVNSSLEMNRLGGRDVVAMAKVLEHHCNLDIRSLAECGIGVLPLLLRRLGRVVSCEELRKYWEKAGRWKFDSVYQFFRGLPEVLISHRNTLESAGVN